MGHYDKKKLYELMFSEVEECNDKIFSNTRINSKGKWEFKKKHRRHVRGEKKRVKP